MNSMLPIKTLWQEFVKIVERSDSRSPVRLATFVSAISPAQRFRSLISAHKSGDVAHLKRFATRTVKNPSRSCSLRHVRRLRDEKADKPGAARNRLKALRALFAWAVEEDLAPRDPTAGVKPIPLRNQSHHSWTLAEVEAFEQRHTVGTKARLAFGLLLYTSWRREDAVRLGPQHIRTVPLPDGTLQKRIIYRQAKNEDRKPIDMDIPLHPALAKLIDITLSGHMTFLVTDYGKPFSVNGFGNRFKDWCRQADLPHCTAHGLRSATAARLAELGATPHEIMAITGHQTLEEVERYTQAAQRRKLAELGHEQVEVNGDQMGNAKGSHQT